MLLFVRVNEVNGDPLTYEVVGDTVTVKDCKETVSGALAVPSSYEGKPITSIGGSAFSGCSRLTSVRIPDSVTSIGDRAFRYCSNLTSVMIGNSITSIGGWAFDYCGSLTSVRIPESVTSIGKKAFAHCSSLTSVTIGNNVTSIGDLAFYDSVSLTSVTIPDSVISIGSRAFEYCGLTSVIIGNSVTSIGSNAFAYCSSLESITFRGNAPTRYTFSGVSDFAKIFINPGATGFGETFAGLPVVVQQRIEISTFSKFAFPFNLSFESKLGSIYIIEASHDLKQWGKIAEVQGTGNSVKVKDSRLPIFPFERNYFRVKLVEQ